MIRPVIDSKFADDVSSRYLYGMSPLLPADMTLLHPEEQEEEQGPAPKYETYLQNINQITQNTEENLIVNLKLDFHFLHKMFSKTLPSVTVPKHLQKSFINNPEKVIQEQLSKPEMMRQLEPMLKKELAPMVLKNEAQPLEQETAEEPKRMVQRQPEKTKPVQKQKTEQIQPKAEKAKTEPKTKKDEVQTKRIKKTEQAKENQKISPAEKNVQQEIKPFPKAPDTLHMQLQNEPEDVLLFTQAERVLAQPAQEETAQKSSTQPRLTAAQQQKQKPAMPTSRTEKNTAARKKQEKAENQKSAQQEKTTGQSVQKQQAETQTQEKPVNTVQTIQQRTEERQKMLHFAQQWIKRQKPILEKAAAGKTGESFYPFVRAAMLHRAMDGTPDEQASALAQLQKMTAEKAAVAAKQPYLQEQVKAAQQARNSRQQLQMLNNEQADKAAAVPAAQTIILNKSEPEMQLLQNLVTKKGQAAQQAAQQLIRWDSRFMQPAHKQSGLAKPAEKINHELIEPMQLRYPEGVTSGQVQPQAQEFTSAHREQQKAAQASAPAKMQHLMPEAEQQILPEQKTETQLAASEKVQHRNGVQAVQMPKPQTKIQTVYRQSPAAAKPFAAGLQNKAAAALTGTALADFVESAAEMQNFVYPELTDTRDRAAAEPMRQLNMSKKPIPPLPMVHKKESQPEKPQENQQEEFNDIQTIQKVVRTTQNETVEKVRAINAPPAIMDPVPVPAQNTTVQINQIADQVYNMLERRLRFENIRKGGF